MNIRENTLVIGIAGLIKSSPQNVQVMPLIIWNLLNSVLQVTFVEPSLPPIGCSLLRHVRQ